MIALDNLDESTPFMVQLNTVGPGPVTIINTIVAPEDQMAEVMAAWKKDSDVMRASAGFISAQLYGGVAGSRVLTNIAVWESGEDLRAAFFNPAFQALLPEYPDGTVSFPTLVTKLAVEGICVA